MPTTLLILLSDALEVLSVLIIIDVILSWAFMFGARGISPYHPWVRALHRVTNPILEPLRMLVPPRKLGGIDISPILALIVIQILQQALLGR